MKVTDHTTTDTLTVVVLEGVQAAESDEDRPGARSSTRRRALAALDRKGTAEERTLHAMLLAVPR
jgi:hypothetical protein